MGTTNRLLWYILTVAALLAGAALYFGTSEEEVPEEQIAKESPRPLRSGGTPVGSFIGLEAGGIFDVVLSSGETEPRIEASDEIVSQVHMELRGETLFLEASGDIESTNSIRVYIPMQGLSEIKLGGLAKVSSEEGLTYQALRITAHGSSTVDLLVEGSALTLDASGSGKMNLRGTAEEMTVNCSGAGQVDASELTAMHVQAIASGSGKMNLRPVEFLYADASGASVIHYVIEPQQMKTTTSGTGVISYDD